MPSTNDPWDLGYLEAVKDILGWLREHGWTDAARKIDDDPRFDR